MFADLLPVRVGSTRARVLLMCDVRIPENRHLYGRADRRRLSVGNDVEHEPERVDEVDEGRVENNKGGVLCGSNDMARDKWQDKETIFDGRHNLSHAWACNIMCDVRTKCLCLYMQCGKVFCSHIPSIAWELKVASERKKQLPEQKKNVVGTTSCCAATGFPVLISTKKFLLFSPGWRSPIIPTLIRRPFIVLLPLRGWRRTCWKIISPSSSRVNLVGALLVTFKLLRILSTLLRWTDWLVSLSSTFKMFCIVDNKRTSLHGNQEVVLSDFHYNFPIPLPRSPFLRCCFVGMVF